MKLFTATPEQIAELPSYNNRWIQNAFSCEPIANDHEEIRKNVIALYAAANLPAPKNIIFVPSPFVLTFAGGFAAAIWYCRKNNNAATRAATNAATRDATYAATRDATNAATRDAQKTELVDFMLACARRLGDDFSMWDGGNQWSAWVSYLSSFDDVYKLESLRDIQRTKFAPYRRLCELSGPRVMHPDFCMVSDRPEVLKVDEQNRPHSLDGPFCRWRDGLSLYYVHGVKVPAYVVESPIDITVEKIEAEPNAEVRRVMVDQYVGGVAKYLLDSNATVVSKDEFGTLYRKDQKDDEAIWMVHVVCPSTKREYFLGVDPNAYGGLKTARAAVASTWRKKDGSMLFQSPQDYAPAIQT